MRLTKTSSRAVYIYVYTYICIYINTYMHTYIYIYIGCNLLRRRVALRGSLIQSWNNSQCVSLSLSLFRSLCPCFALSVCLSFSLSPPLSLSLSLTPLGSAFESWKLSFESWKLPQWRGLRRNFNTQNRYFLDLQISVDLSGNLWR